MDWIRLFTLLVMTVLVSFVSTEGTRKKIRIHIPQKVKHIHHHKKIYITQHSATAQYAPAFLPTAEGTVAIPGALALPTGMAGLVPLKPIPLYEERRSGRLPGVSSANSPLLPMYRARGYYGPAPAWDRPERETDLQPPPYSPSFSGPSGPSAFSSPSSPSGPSTQSKRVKVIKVTEPRKKTIIKKKKPKRIIIQDLSDDDERPVSTFHEQFYADVDQVGTIKKTRKPKRVEKIIDGDTEHIHTYSEEHIHRVVFDEPKIPDVSGAAALAGLGAANSLLPLNAASPSLFSVDSSLQHPLISAGAQNAFSNIGTMGSLGAGSFGSIGSLGTPANMEFMAYNPRDVTHDHVYHDHGEVGEDFDFNKNLGIPPKTYKAPTYGHIKQRPKGKWVTQENKIKPTKNPEYAYYENMYTPGQKPKPNPVTYPRYAPNNEISHPSYNPEINFEEARPTFKPKYKYKPKPIASTYHVQNPNNKPSNGLRTLHHSADTPHSTSSTILHDAPYKPTKQSYQGVQDSPLSSFTSYKDQFTSFKDMYSPPNNYETDAYASPSNSFNNQNDDSSANSYWQTKSKSKSKKKSISTQNISFGGQDHKTIVDHMAESSNISPVVSSSADERTTERTTIEDIATPAVEYGITDYSPAHDYYTAMAIKAFQENPIAVPDASNNNYHIVDPPSPQGTAAPSIPTTTDAYVPIPIYVQDTNTHTTPAPYVSTHTMQISRNTKRAKNKLIGIRQPLHPIQTKQQLQMVQAKHLQKSQPPIRQEKTQLLKLSPEERGKLKYGDRLQDRFDYDYQV